MNEQSPSERLANICAALEEHLNESPYTREEWALLDAERMELLKANDALAARLAEVERAARALLLEINAHEIKTPLSSTSIHWFARKLREALPETVAARRAEPAAGKDAIETGWVIEGDWSPTSAPDYWVGSSAWSPDSAKALRFARCQDAEQAANFMCAGLSVRVCCHQWEIPASAAAEPAGEAIAYGCTGCQSTPCVCNEMIAPEVRDD